MKPESLVMAHQLRRREDSGIERNQSSKKTTVAHNSVFAVHRLNAGSRVKRDPAFSWRLAFQAFASPARTSADSASSLSRMTGKMPNFRMQPRIARISRIGVGSARVSRAGFGVSPKQSFFKTDFASGNCCLQAAGNGRLVACAPQIDWRDAPPSRPKFLL